MHAKSHKNTCLRYGGQNKNFTGTKTFVRFLSTKNPVWPLPYLTYWMKLTNTARQRYFNSKKCNVTGLLIINIYPIEQPKEIESNITKHTYCGYVELP